MLNKVNETNDLRKGDKLMSGTLTKLVRSTRGLHVKSSNKLTGLFDIIKLKKKLLEEEELQKKRLLLGVGSSVTLDS